MVKITSIAENAGKNFEIAFIATDGIIQIRKTLLFVFKARPSSKFSDD
jgi:hypothetical protein